MRYLTIILFLLLIIPGIAKPAEPADIEPVSNEISQIEWFIMRWTEVRRNSPVRKIADQVAKWVVKAVDGLPVTPWELLFVCCKETSLIPRPGIVGEIGPGQLHGAALKYARKMVGVSRDALRGQSEASYRGVAEWLAFCKRKCPEYPYGFYHTGRCQDHHYNRDVRRMLMTIDRVLSE